MFCRKGVGLELQGGFLTVRIAGYMPSSVELSVFGQG